MDFQREEAWAEEAEEVLFGLNVVKRAGGDGGEEKGSATEH